MAYLQSCLYIYFSFVLTGSFLVQKFSYSTHSQILTTSSFRFYHKEFADCCCIEFFEEVELSTKIYITL